MDAIVDAIPRGNDEQGRLNTPAARKRENFKPVRAGQAKIEQRNRIAAIAQRLASA